MFLDRVFGMTAAAAFALGAIAQVKLLGSADSPNPFDPLLVAFAALAVVAQGYVILRAEARHGLYNPAYEEIDLVDVAYSLPVGMIALCAVLVAYVGLLCVSIRNPALLALVPDEVSVLRQSIPANGIVATVVAFFATSSFVIAAYLLVQKPIKEFH